MHQGILSWKLTLLAWMNIIAEKMLSAKGLGAVAVVGVVGWPLGEDQTAARLRGCCPVGRAGRLIPAARFLGATDH